MSAGRGIVLCTVLTLVTSTIACEGTPPTLVVGSKKFTESVVLGEVVAAVARAQGIVTTHRVELGGTRVVFDALVAGDIDIYVEYSGTLAAELVDDKTISANDLERLRADLGSKGIVVLDPLGFNNTYAMAMKRERAAALNIATTSDLAQHPSLSFALSNEFLERKDGWNALQSAYGLPHTDVRGLDHALAYRAVDDGARDVMEVYTTDPQITANDLKVLDDDRGHFPSYLATILVRADALERFPSLKEALKKLSGAIDVDTMGKMNAQAEIDRVPEAEVASMFVSTALGVEVVAQAPGPSRFWTDTKDHLVLVGISLALALLFALPLGAFAAKVRWLRAPVLGVVSVLQTVPSLALLVFLIPLLGVGAAPAIVALFLYSLLPIVRNTVAGLDSISPALHESGIALGLPPQTRLWKIELPLALPSILAGIKTAAVINVGTATLGAIIGAGGYGQPILTGIRVGSTAMILQGAVPAAALALLVSGAFDGLERLVVSPGLRPPSTGK